MEKPTKESLKARAYDLIAAKEQIEMELRHTNQMINQMAQEEKEKPEKPKDSKSK